MGRALRDTFHTVDTEILNRSREEDGQDGATGLVLLRVGMVTSCQTSQRFPLLSHQGVIC